jgi:hypothetical protein
VAARIDPVLLRRWLIRNVTWLAAGTLVAGLAVASAGPVLGSAPPQHKVVICHATPPDTARNGWHKITVDVASVGYRHAGHQTEHDADIIPPYAYGSLTFEGKNWTSDGQAIWANDCRAVAPTPTATTAPTPGPTATPTTTPTATPTGEVEPTATTAPTATASATPTGEVEPATGTPATTLPPTDTSSSTGGSSLLGLLAILGVLATASVVAFSTADRSAPRRR